MSLKTLSVDETRRLVADGAVLIDVREPAEFRRGHIEGAVPMPLSAFDPAAFAGYRGRKVIFLCQSGGRTTTYARHLENAVAGVCEGYVMGGGMMAWQRAGLATAGGKPAGPGLLARLFNRG